MSTIWDHNMCTHMDGMSVLHTAVTYVICAMNEAIGFVVMYNSDYY